MLPVDSGDGIVEPGVGGDKPVCDGPIATDRRIGTGPLPVGRHNSMSLLQAPNSMSLDGGARVVGTGTSLSVVEVGRSMPGCIDLFSLAVARSVGDTISAGGAEEIPSDIT